MIIPLFKMFALAVAMSCLAMMLYVTAVLADDRKTFQKMLPILCTSVEHFKTHISSTQKLWIIGVIPELPTHILEIHRNPHDNASPHTWTVAIRHANQKEICVVAAGNHLIHSPLIK